MTTAAEALPAAVRAQLEAFLDALYQAGLALNLTRIPRAQAWERHVLESLALLDARPWTPGERVVDLGSGGGVPGIPLALAGPRLDCVLVEKSRRKAEVLRRLQARLGLTGVTVIGAPAEEVAAMPGWRPADVVVSRAAAAPAELVGLAMPLLRPGGELLAHVGTSATVDRALVEAARAAGASRPVIEVAAPVRWLRCRAAGPGRVGRRSPPR